MSEPIPPYEPQCHSRASGNPAQRVRQDWIPAFAGMTAITIAARELRRFLEGLGYV